MHSLVVVTQDLPDFTQWTTFPFTGEFSVKALDPPVIPEPPRNGEDGPETCGTCQHGDDDDLWSNEHWRVTTTDDPIALPGALFLLSREHYDLGTMPPERAAELGPMIQRLERALLAIGGVARVHVSRWGDGGAHFHMWFFARPEGALQLRGTFLPIWDEVLPKLDEATWRRNVEAVRVDLARG